MKFKLHIFIILATTLSFSCSSHQDIESADTDERPPDLVIISTNDIHSNINRIPKLASLTKRLREDHKNVVLLDAGDRQNGYASVDYAEKPGQGIIEMMNMLGYNAATLGDHEFDYGQQALTYNIKHSSFDILCANISSNNLPEIEPYKYIQINNKKIVILGLINVDKNTRRTPALANKLVDISFEDPLIVAKQYKPLTSRADMFISLSHCGLYTDSIICNEVPQMDLIIGGGNHEPLLNQKEVNGVIITATGNGLKYAGLTKIWFTKKGNIECKNTLIDLDAYRDDAEFKVILDKIKSQTNFSKVIGTNSANMNRIDLTSMFCKSIMKSCSTNHALYNYSSINRDLQPKGVFTLEDLYNIESYKYNYYCVEISVKTLDNIIREDYIQQGKKDGEKTIHAEGISYNIGTDNKGNITNITYYDQANIITDLSQKITFSINEYIYITYKHLIGIDSQPLETVTSSVINYYSN